MSLDVLDEHLNQVAIETQDLPNGRQVRTEVLEDHARTVINRVDSADLHMKWTINPYRGCEHGCVYCYARPNHEYLGLSSGMDFESKIFAKTHAAKLLKQELASSSWEGEPIVMSGVTDPYQPVESKLKITRRVLQVLADARQAVSIITKSRMILRDMDYLIRLNRHGAVSVAVSVTTLDAKLSAKLEPRAASPKDRLWTIRRLASAGIPVMAMVAPVIPALNDHEIPNILEAVTEAGATRAGYIMVRLPHQIKDLFADWLATHYPEKHSHVMTMLRDVRNGQLYDSNWHTRMRGEGPYAEQIAETFKVFTKRLGLNRERPGLNTGAFRKPARDGQLSLFR